MKKRYKIEGHGIKLLAFLRDATEGAVSVKAIKRAIDGKRCKVNGRTETFSTYTLSKGDVVEIDLEQEKQQKAAVLYEDEALLIINKPAGLICEPKNFRAKLVHRLDKETSGVLILAKNETMRQKMIDLFSKRLVKKEYLAIVDGEVKKKEGTISSRLAKQHSYQGQTIYGSSRSGLSAITHWKRLSVGKKASLLLCEPVTGRTHQLRVHLKEMGHPILGDTQYAKNFVCPYHPHRHLLHAVRIVFPHPLTDVRYKTVDIKAEPPVDFAEALEFIGCSQYH